MRLVTNPDTIHVWLSATDTYLWATKPGAAWPCSQLSGVRVFAEFDSDGLLDMSIDGETRDCDANEFNALMADHLRGKVLTHHPAYFVAVGQFPTPDGVMDHGDDTGHPA